MMKTQTGGQTVGTLVMLSLSLNAFAQTQAGQIFSATVVAEKNGKKEGKTLVFKGSVAGNNGRLDVIQGDDEYKTGDFVITNDGGETFWTVSAKKKEAVHMTPEAIRKLIRKESFSVKEVSLSPPVPLGRGESVGGNETDLYRMSRRYTIEARQFIFSEKIALTETWDFAIAPAAVGTPSFNPPVSFLALESSAVLFKNDAFATGGYRKTVPKGFPLKVTVAATSLNKKKQERSTMTVTCDVPVASAFEAAWFTVPAGFKRKE